MLDRGGRGRLGGGEHPQRGGDAVTGGEQPQAEIPGQIGILDTVGRVGGVDQGGVEGGEGLRQVCGIIEGGSYTVNLLAVCRREIFSRSVNLCYTGTYE